MSSKTSEIFGQRRRVCAAVVVETRVRGKGLRNKVIETLFAGFDRMFAQRGELSKEYGVLAVS